VGLQMLLAPGLPELRHKEVPFSQSLSSFGSP
jgi:hypothetical protein